MSTKCTKLFEKIEDARGFALKHREDGAKMRRSTENERSILNCTNQWAVIWYEHPYQGAKPAREYHNQHSCDYTPVLNP